MLRTRILLIVISGVVIWLLFQLPKVVVENSNKQLGSDSATSTTGNSSTPHADVPLKLVEKIAQLRVKFRGVTEKEKNAIFADSLANLYSEAANFDSSAWFSEVAAAFFNTAASWAKVGDQYYQAYTFAVDDAKQAQMAEKARTFYTKALEADPSNLTIKTKMAMTYMSSSNPMQGIMLLREVLAEDPGNEEALFNMGMLSIQSGQNDRAIERFEELVKVNPGHIQGQLLLGVAYLNKGDRERARTQFKKVKEMDNDPAVQATVDSYLEDLK